MADMSKILLFSNEDQFSRSMLYDKLYDKYKYFMCNTLTPVIAMITKSIAT